MEYPVFVLLVFINLRYNSAVPLIHGQNQNKLNSVRGLPGHALIKPEVTMLKSASQYPRNEFQAGNLVYGNLKNLGIRYGKVPEYVSYSEFRKSQILDALMDLRRNSRSMQSKWRIDKPLKVLILNPDNNIESVFSKYNYENNPMVAHKDINFMYRLPKNIEYKAKQQRKIPFSLMMVLPPLARNSNRQPLTEYTSKEIDFQERESSAESQEILNIDTSSGDSEEQFTYRKFNNEKKERLRRLKVYKSRDRGRSRNESDSDSSGDSTDKEKNPGNPYTIHKNKYLQNWMWNYEMTGDHMNMNPFAPIFMDTGPVKKVFHGRKWWYFNQDDYLPLRR